MKLTKEQIAEYIVGGAVRCPFCGSEDLAGSSVDVESGFAFQTVSCGTCGESWRDEYRLVDIVSPD